jgi:hypothetical protein
VLDVEGWAQLRREHFVRGVSIKELVRRTGMSRISDDRDGSSRRVRRFTCARGAYGVMFWFRWKRLSGSYLRLTSTRRS